VPPPSSTPTYQSPNYVFLHLRKRVCCHHSTHQPDFLHNNFIQRPPFSWCFSDVAFDSQSVAHIAALIQSGEVLAVSDGSYKDGAGFPSWILESKDRTIWIKLTVICPGVSTAHSSYRSELMGILSLFLTVDKITSYYQVPFGNIEVACDGDSALKAAFCHRLSLKMDDPDSDLISAIHFHRQKSRITW
jgi:hypothetical protein